MQMNSGIILSGQQPNLLAAMMEGQQAAQQQNALATERQTKALYAQHGAGLVSGDPTAINALAGINPQAALGVQDARLGMDRTRLGMDATRLGMDQTRQEMQFSQERLQMDYARAAQEAQQAAANLSKEQREAEAAKLDGLLSGAAFFYSKGDRAGYEAFARDNGMDPAQYPFEQFPAIAARGKGTLDALKTFSDMAKGPEGPKPTADMIEYDAAKRQGYTGSLQDWIVGQKKASAPGVTVNTGDNSGAFVKKGDEIAAVRYDDIVKNGQSAQSFMGDMQALSTLAGQIGTGKEAQVKAMIGPYAEAMGIKVDGLSEMQAFEAIRDRLVPQMRTPGAGATSDFDARMFLNSLPTLAKTPDGNQMVTDTLAAVQQHKMAAAAIAGRVFSGEMTWQEGDKQIAALGNPFDKFNASRGRIEGGAGAPRQTGPVEIDGFKIEALD